MNHRFNIVIAVLVLLGVETELFVVTCALDVILPLPWINLANLAEMGKVGGWGGFGGFTSSSVWVMYFRDSWSRHFRISRLILGMIICVKINSPNFASLASKSSCACSSPDVVREMAGRIGSFELCPTAAVVGGGLKAVLRSMAGDVGAGVGGGDCEAEERAL
jgi:hypothetical protein